MKMSYGTLTCEGSLGKQKNDAIGCATKIVEGHFCLALCSFTPPVLWWLSPGERWDAVGMN